MNATVQFQLQYLRAQSSQRMLEAVTVFVAALFVSALLPSLLVRYVYAGQALFEQPPVLDMIPVVAFVIAIGYFLFAVVGNVMREMRMRVLERQVMGEAPRVVEAPASVSDLTAAMSRVERSTAKTTRGRRVTRRK